MTITAQAVAAYARRDRDALARALNLHAAHFNPLDCVGPAPFPARSAAAMYWAQARRTRQALAAAAAVRPLAVYDSGPRD